MEKDNPSQSLFELFQKLETKIAVLEKQLTAQKEEIQNLKAKLAATETVSSSDTVVVENVSEIKTATRRTILRRLAAGLLAGAAFTALPASALPVQARSIVSPKSYGSDIGAIVVSKATQISGQPTDTTANFGLIATGDPQLDMSKLPVYDTGVYAKGGGYGVYATTDRFSAPAVYASNTSTGTFGPGGYAIQAISNSGTAIYGSASLNGVGVYAVASGNGPGVYAQSSSGPALHLEPVNNPPTSIHAYGDVYVAMGTGKFYVWARNDANTADGWRQLAFAT